MTAAVVARPGAAELGVQTMLGRRLGAELRSARQARGWSRPRMLRRLRVQTGQERCEQTLRCYEIGSRQISVPRLIEVCAVLGVRAEVILEAALRHVFGGSAPGTDAGAVSVHLPTLLASRAPELAALRAWARVQASPGERIDLNQVALAQLAVLTGVDDAALRTTLLTELPDAIETAGGTNE